MYLIEVDERKSRNNIDRGKISRDYKSEDDGLDRFYKKSKRGDDGFLNKMRKELGIVKGFFRTSSSTKEGNKLWVYLIWKCALDLFLDQKLKTATLQSILSRGRMNTTNISTCLPKSVLKFKRKHGLDRQKINGGQQQECKIKIPDFKNVR